jgi:hypothetical protein
MSTDVKFVEAPAQATELVRQVSVMVPPLTEALANSPVTSDDVPGEAIGRLATVVVQECDIGRGSVNSASEDRSSTTIPPVELLTLDTMNVAVCGTGWSPITQKSGRATQSTPPGRVVVVVLVVVLVEVLLVVVVDVVVVLVVVVVVVVVVVGVTLGPRSAEELPPPADPVEELPTWPQTETETHKAEIRMIAIFNIILKSFFIFNARYNFTES